MNNKDIDINLSSIEDIIEDARNGKMYILVDDPDRENEGDLIIPAQYSTPHAINFITSRIDSLVNIQTRKEKHRFFGPRMRETIRIRAGDHLASFDIDKTLATERLIESMPARSLPLFDLRTSRLIFSTFKTSFFFLRISDLFFIFILFSCF